VKREWALAVGLAAADAASSCEEKTSDEPELFLSAREVAERLKLPAEATRKKLDRYRSDHLVDGRNWMERAETGPNEPRFLYRFQAVADILKSDGEP